MNPQDFRSLQEAYLEIYQPQYIDEEVEIATEYFYEMGLNEDGVSILIEELGEDEFIEWVYDIAEEYTLTEARRSGRIEPVTKTGKSVGSLKGGAKTAAINRLRKEKEASRSREGNQSNSSSMTAALRSQSMKAAASKQKSSNSTPEQKKKGIGGLIGAAVKRAKQDTELLKKSWNTAREAGKPVERKVAGAAGTVAGAIRGAGEVVHRAGVEAGKSKTGQNIKKGLGKTAMAAAGAAGAGLGSLRAGKSPAAAAGRAAGTFVRKIAKEEVDIYDIILSHLLDEGYAETLEAAETIMVHMSEDWRDSIVSNFID